MFDISSEVIADTIQGGAKIHRLRCNLGHFLQMSLQLLVKMAENNVYHNEAYESWPPCIWLSYDRVYDYMIHPVYDPPLYMYRHPEYDCHMTENYYTTTLSYDRAYDYTI